MIRMRSGPNTAKRVELDSKPCHQGEKTPPLIITNVFHQMFETAKFERSLQLRGPACGKPWRPDSIIWEPDSPDDEALNITYKQLHTHVCRFAKY